MHDFIDVICGSNAINFPFRPLTHSEQQPALFQSHIQKVLLSSCSRAFNLRFQSLLKWHWGPPLSLSRLFHLILKVLSCSGWPGMSVRNDGNYICESAARSHSSLDVARGCRAERILSSAKPHHKSCEGYLNREWSEALSELAEPEVKLLTTTTERERKTEIIRWHGFFINYVRPTDLARCFKVSVDLRSLFSGRAEIY